MFLLVCTLILMFLFVLYCGATLPARNFIVLGTLPAHNFIVLGTLPARNFIVLGTLPA